MDAINYITEVLGWTAFHALWQILAIVVLLKIILFLLPTTAYRSKLAVLGSGILLIGLSAIATFFYLFDPHAVSTAPVEHLPLQYYMFSAPIQESSQFGVFYWLSEYSHWVGTLWIMGTIGLFLYWGSGYFYVKKLQRNSRPLKGKWMEKIRSWTAQSSRKGQLRLALSPRVMSPVLTGILQPVILFPAGMWQAFDEDQIECILRHEWLHWKRYDHLVNIALIIFESIYFFHPLAWWLSKEVRHLQELIVDQETITHTQAPVQYAKTLFKVQQLALQPHLGMTAFASGKGKLLHRIERILSPTQGRKTKIMNTQSIGIFAVSFFFIVLGSLGAYSMKGEKAQAEIFNNPVEEKPVVIAPVDSLPAKEAIEVDDFTIILDKDGWVESVDHRARKRKWVIKDKEGNQSKEVDIKEIKKPGQSVDYEVERKIVKKDGRTDTVEQVIIRKPEREAKREVKVIKVPGDHVIEIRAARGELKGALNLPRVIHFSGGTSFHDEELHFAPPEGLRFYFSKDTMPSEEEWAAFQQRMQEFSQRMAEWGQRFAQKMQEHMNDDSLQLLVERMQKDMPKPDWSEEEKAAFESKMEAYGERMKAWGERFERKMGLWKERYEKELEAIERQMEEAPEELELPPMPPPPPPAPPALPEEPDTPPPPPSPDDE